MSWAERLAIGLSVWVLASFVLAWMVGRAIEAGDADGRERPGRRLRSG